MSKPRVTPFERALDAIEELTPEQQANVMILLKRNAKPPVNEATPLGTPVKRGGGRRKRGLPATAETPVGQ